MAERSQLRLGDVRIEAIPTPGHTPEHLAYGVFDAAACEPAAVFTGGSLTVGAAPGRTDRPARRRPTEELTRSQQYSSLRRLSALPDDALVLPTHGAGSFCSAGAGQRDRTSTPGAERASNPALGAADEEAFVRQQLDGLSPYPRFYAHLAPIDRAGPKARSELPRAAERRRAGRAPRRRRRARRRAR